jgi:hypothetical protein
MVEIKSKNKKNVWKYHIWYKQFKISDQSKILIKKISRFSKQFLNKDFNKNTSKFRQLKKEKSRNKKRFLINQKIIILKIYNI